MNELLIHSKHTLPDFPSLTLKRGDNVFSFEGSLPNAIHAYLSSRNISFSIQRAKP